MKQSVTSLKIDEKDYLFFLTQDKLQKKRLLLSPLMITIGIIIGIMVFNGAMPPMYIICLGIIPMISATIYAPIVAGIKLGKVFYSISTLPENNIEFKSIGTLWRGDKRFVINLNEIKVEKVPLKKLLFNRFEINTIYLRGKKYYVFTKLLIDSNLLESLG